MFLRNLLGFLGGDPGQLRSLGVRVGLGLLRLLGALGGKPRPLLFGQPCLFGGSYPRLFGGDLLELKLGEARVETIRIYCARNAFSALLLPICSANS